MTSNFKMGFHTSVLKGAAPRNNRDVPREGYPEPPARFSRTHLKHFRPLPCTLRSSETWRKLLSNFSRLQFSRNKEWKILRQSGKFQNIFRCKARDGTHNRRTCLLQLLLSYTSSSPCNLNNAHLGSARGPQWTWYRTLICLIHPQWCECHQSHYHPSPSLAH